MSRVCAALADPGRRQVVGLLRQRPMTEEELRAGLGARASMRLSGDCAILRSVGLVGAMTLGERFTYWLCASVLEETLWMIASAFGRGSRPGSRSGSRSRGGDGASRTGAQALLLPLMVLALLAQLLSGAVGDLATAAGGAQALRVVWIGVEHGGGQP